MPSCHALQVLAVRDRVCMGEYIDNQIPLTELALTEIVPTEEELNYYSNINFTLYKMLKI